MAKSGHQDGPMGRGTEHDTDTSSIYLNVQPPDERPHETNQYSISYPPERSKSQSRRGREPPVIIGDPTVSLFRGVWSEESQCGMDLR